MKIWEALVLGLVQGASEFLPVSSSGHLLLLEKCGIGEESLFFNIALHIGTLVAVLIAMRKKWIPLVRHPLNKTNLYIILASLPTVALALVFKAFFPTLLDGAYLGCGFVLTSVLLFAGQNFNLRKKTLLDAKTSILTGVFQGIAVLPGVSRSGATISALTFQGIEKEEATTFSFLLSIPIIIGSALYESIGLFVGGNALSIPIPSLIVGIISAFLSGLLAIKFMLKTVEKYSMNVFIVYTLLLGTVISILGFVC